MERNKIEFGFEGREGFIRELSEAYGAWKVFSREITAVTGIGETTRRKGFAEKRARVRLRQVLFEFFRDFADKERLPDWIACTEDRRPDLGSWSKKYFLPRVNGVYEIYSSEYIHPAFEDDLRFVPEAPEFMGSEALARVIRQNEERNEKLPGLYLQSSAPRKSQTVVLSLDDHQLGEALEDDDVEIVLEELRRYLIDPSDISLMTNLETRIKEIRREQDEEQKESERKFAELAREKLRGLAGLIERYVPGLVKDRLPLRDEEYFSLERGMISFARARRRRTGKEKPSPEKEQIYQAYFSVRDGSIEFVPVKKVLLGRFREQKSERRTASNRQFLEQRWEIRSALGGLLPQEIRDQAGFH